MHVLGKFPVRRMRRLRRDDFSRRMVREHRLSADDFIYPVFVIDGQNRSEAVPSMPGVERLTIDRLLQAGRALRRAWGAGDRVVSGRGQQAQDRRCPRSVQSRRARCPSHPGAERTVSRNLGVITDIALDPYTSHGQDGLIDDSGYVLNDETIEALVKQALTHAEAGVDIVAPSDMMDGRVGALRGRWMREGISTRASWRMRPSMRPVSMARFATQSARRQTWARATSTPTRSIRPTATRRCGKWEWTSKRARTW